MKSIAIIPARGGSKGIPNKNVMDFCGKPLVVWSILHAKSAELVEEVCVSSDSDEILAVAEKNGATPIRRPIDISGDFATSESAIVHTLDFIEKRDGVEPDIVVMLQPTSPIRRSYDIQNALNQFIEKQADAMFSASVLDDFCIWSQDANGLNAISYDPGERGRRQERAPLWLESGSFYIFKSSLLKEKNNRLGGKTATYEMPYWASYEIDEPEDIKKCEFFFNNYLLSKGESFDNGFKVSDVDLIVYDFDGVMTDNRVLVNQDGTEAVLANRADGLGVGTFKKLGLAQMILSTETNSVVAARAKKLKIDVIQGCDDKASALTEYCNSNSIEIDRVLYVGNDLNDLEAMQLVGLPAAPSDAHRRILDIAKITTQAAGGEGVIKELSELISV